MDHRDLLIKYIRHVLQSEGWSYIGDENTGHSSVRFTDDEKRELESLLTIARAANEDDPNSARTPALR